MPSIRIVDFLKRDGSSQMPLIRERTSTAAQFSQYGSGMRLAWRHAISLAERTTRSALSALLPATGAARPLYQASPASRLHHKWAHQRDHPVGDFQASVAPCASASPQRVTHVGNTSSECHQVLMGGKVVSKYQSVCICVVWIYRSSLSSKPPL